MPTVERQIAKSDGTNTIAFGIDHRLYGEIELLSVGTACAQRTPRKIIYLRQAKGFILFGHINLLDIDPVGACLNPKLSSLRAQRSNLQQTGPSQMEIASSLRSSQ
jgi:hypothetical protein